MKKKVTSFFFIIFIFLFFYININMNNSLAEEKDSVVIERLIPHPGEQNIISTPEIKIFYNSNNTLNNFKLYLNYKDISNQTMITSKYIYYKCDKKLKPGVQVVKLEIKNTPKPEVMEWYFSVGTNLYTNYKGIFFNNTDELNILTSYDDLNNLCKNTKHLNYLFITEKINNNKLSMDNFIDNKKYNKLIESCNKYCNDCSFISLSGFELSTKLKNENKKTCLNIFNCENPFIFKDNISMDSFYKNLFFYEDDLIGQFRYDNNLDSINYFKYSPYGDEIISLIELQKDANKKLNLIPYKEALDNGWHISPIICEYNQYPNINLNNKFLTNILCEDLTKNQLLEGIKNRRIFISENNNLDVYFSLNKLPMGSIVKNPSYVRIIVSAIANSNNDKIKKIEIFSNNDKLICSKNFDSNFTKVDFTLPPPNKNTYYFALITEKDNKETLTSPIWIEY